MFKYKTSDFRVPPPGSENIRLSLKNCKESLNRFTRGNVKEQSQQNS
jgi:hypothetical protein